MFFHASNFREVFSEDEAIFIAKVANNVLDQHSKIIYGNAYQDGRCDNFSTEKKRIDTHVALAVDVSEMGAFRPSGSPIALERPSQEDLTRAQAEYIKRLEREKAMKKGGIE